MSVRTMETSEQPPGESRGPDPADLQCQIWWKRFIVKAALNVITSPYRRAFKLYTWKPLQDLRRADGDRRVFIPLVRDWKVDKYAELQSVQVAASFCAGATMATISWTGMPRQIWWSDALWFSSLICSIWAIITSIQTKSILDDIPDREQLNQRLPDCELKRMRRVILRYKRTPGLGHWTMLFIWQFPSMTMSYAWCTFLTGLTVYICTPFIRREKWGDNHKIACVYLTVCGIGCITYLFSSIFVYTSEKAALQSAANTRHNTDDTDPESYDFHTSIPVSDKQPLTPNGAESQTFDFQHSNPTSYRRAPTPTPTEAERGLDTIPEESSTIRRAQTLPLPDRERERSSLLPRKRFWFG